MHGPYLPLPKAAEYCGYSTDRFRKIVRDYELPKYGPHRNKFSPVDLDLWMHDPESFKVREKRRSRKIMKLTLDAPA